jgi:hypothetical protein
MSKFEIFNWLPKNYHKNERLEDQEFNQDDIKPLRIFNKSNK